MNGSTWGGMGTLARDPRLRIWELELGTWSGVQVYRFGPWLDGGGGWMVEVTGWQCFIYHWEEGQGRMSGGRTKDPRWLQVVVWVGEWEHSWLDGVGSTKH